jgi:hypothetical protein
MYPRYDFEPWAAEVKAKLNNRFAGQPISENLLICIEMCLYGEIRDLREISDEADYWLLGVQMYWEDRDVIGYKLVLREGYEASKADQNRTR